MPKPTKEEFIDLSRRGNLVPVMREILADLETPVSAFMKLDRGENAFLLESVEGGETWARYSFLGAGCRRVVRARGRRVEVLKDGAVEKSREYADPLDGLREVMASYTPVRPEGFPIFYGGAVGYLSYDMVRHFERLPESAADDMGFDDFVFLVTDLLVAFDNVAQKIKIIAVADLGDHENPEAAYDDAVRRIDETVERLRKPLDYRYSAQGADLSVASNFAEEDFKKAVATMTDYIKAGDAIQIVLSQRFEARGKVNHFNLYRALRTLNPSPYMFYLRLGDLKLMGSSPEVMVRLEERRVTVRPIAGTRKRGADEKEDRALEVELLADPKERAEHIMLVDLGRNDVGRVAETGSVKVDELMTIERYSHVMHIVSNVTGVLRGGLDAFDVLRATFPAGTLRGAPKIRAMEIIDELEPTRRGPYGGAVGYFGFSGNMDTCITIRTFMAKGEKLYFQVGAGIVADSRPDFEFAETLSKSAALRRTIEMVREGID